jgi:hypothetical protein
LIHNGFSATVEVMEDMVERVARALCRRQAERSAAPALSEWEMGQHVDAWWPDCVDDARAAIEAMREPTNYMETAAYGVRDPHSDFTAPSTLYRAMIDAALTKEPA